MMGRDERRKGFYCGKPLLKSEIEKW